MLHALSVTFLVCIFIHICSVQLIAWGEIEIGLLPRRRKQNTSLVVARFCIARMKSNLHTIWHQLFFMFVFWRIAQASFLIDSVIGTTQLKLSEEAQECYDVLVLRVYCNWIWVARRLVFLQCILDAENAVALCDKYIVLSHLKTTLCIIALITCEQNEVHTLHALSFTFLVCIFIHILQYS